MSREPLDSDDDDDRSYPPDEAALRAFYKSPEWRRLAYETKLDFGWQCQCCGATADDGVRIVSDHIRPARFYWHLRLERSNIAVLCDECNLGKASWDQTDYRISRRDRLREAVRHYAKYERGPKLKHAIILAHSFDAMSHTEVVELFSRYPGLKCA